MFEQQFRKNRKNQAHAILCIWVSTPFPTPPPPPHHLFFAKAPLLLNLQIVQASLLANFLLYISFSWTPLKNEFSSEPHNIKIFYP